MLRGEEDTRSWSAASREPGSRREYRRETPSEPTAARRGPKSRTEGPAPAGGWGERRARAREEAAEPRVGAAQGARPRRRVFPSAEKGRGRRPPSAESGVCAVLLVNKKERGGASYCCAGKLQPALLIGLTEP